MTWQSFSIINGGGLHSIMDSVLAMHPAAPGSIPGVPKIFSEFLMLPRLTDSAAAQSNGQQKLIV